MPNKMAAANAWMMPLCISIPGVRNLTIGLQDQAYY